VSHFIETTPSFGIFDTASSNISWKIIHTGRADTGDFMRMAKNVDFLFRICRRFYDYPDFLRHFSRIIRYMIFHCGMGLYNTRTYYSKISSTPPHYNLA
jgi:hypothetical protein